MLYKEKTEYTTADANFQPLPKHGHLSKMTPEFAELKDATDQMFKPMWEITDMATLLKVGRTDPGTTYEDRGIVTEFIQFPASDGTLIELKIYRQPKVQENAALILRLHGGGWMVGCHETDGEENAQAAANHNVVVASVNYRMAPEFPFPQPLYDAYDALVWCKANAEKLGVNPERIILAGGSAGANLTAALALLARDNGITGILAQILHFPIICHPKFFPRDKYEFGSYMQNANASVLDAIKMEMALDTYIPDAKPDFRHSPILAESHKGLPPLLLQCAGLDPLRDEAIAYAEVVQEAGVEVEHYAYQGLPHHFHTVVPTVPECKPFYARYHAFLTKILQ
ncbi:unnamed protein product [Clonostachys chloroleuca]|uniref:Alpha/beta hydrolase fold-3 domain-containing protein n=1 Tax=Clonostachys chloroleuca TaxID=1926264 RepID=A0AA35MCF6_9HYPO|nr:unnamed protein product [Clonostachys chloroleuca]